MSEAILALINRSQIKVTEAEDERQRAREAEELETSRECAKNLTALWPCIDSLIPVELRPYTRLLPEDGYVPDPERHCRFNLLITGVDGLSSIRCSIIRYDADRPFEFERVFPFSVRLQKETYCGGIDEAIVKARDLWIKEQEAPSSEGAPNELSSIVAMSSGDEIESIIRQIIGEKVEEMVCSGDLAGVRMGHWES